MPEGNVVVPLAKPFELMKSLWCGGPNSMRNRKWDRCSEVKTQWLRCQSRWEVHSWSHPGLFDSLGRQDLDRKGQVKTGKLGGLTRTVPEIWQAALAA